MKLFVDDIRNPLEDGWTIARDITTAIRMLHSTEFTHISLDHDIGGYDETFMPVCMFLATKYWHERMLVGLDGLKEARLNWVPKVTIHSNNPVGAEAMYKILKDVGITALIDPFRV